MNILSKVLIEFLFQLRFGKYQKEDAELALLLLLIVCVCVCVLMRISIFKGVEQHTSLFGFGLAESKEQFRGNLI